MSNSLTAFLNLPFSIREIALHMQEVDKELTNFHIEPEDNGTLYLPSPRDVKAALNDFAQKHMSKPLNFLGKVIAEVGEELKSTKVARQTPPPTPPRPSSFVYPSQHPQPQAVMQQDHVYPATVTNNRFERDLSREERELLDDYEMQLALALSLSLEEDKKSTGEDEIPAEILQQSLADQAKPTEAPAAGDLIKFD
jgi:hypothetical protein